MATLIAKLKTNEKLARMLAKFNAIAENCKIEINQNELKVGFLVDETELQGGEKRGKKIVGQIVIKKGEFQHYVFKETNKIGEDANSTFFQFLTFYHFVTQAPMGSEMILFLDCNPNKPEFILTVPASRSMVDAQPVLRTPASLLDAFLIEKVSNCKAPNKESIFERKMVLSNPVSILDRFPLHKGGLRLTVPLSALLKHMEQSAETQEAVTFVVSHDRVITETATLVDEYPSDHCKVEGLCLVDEVRFSLHFNHLAHLGLIELCKAGADGVEFGITASRVLIMTVQFGDLLIHFAFSPGSISDPTAECPKQELLSTLPS